MKQVFFILCAFTLGLLVLCCGASGLFSPAKKKAGTPRGDTEAAEPVAASPSILEEPSPIRTDPQPIYDTKIREYQAQVVQWERNQELLADARSRQSALKSMIESHNINLPSQPILSEREWMTVDKRFKTIATMIESDNVVVMLQKSNGQEISVPKNQLIAEDRFYV